MSIYVRHRCWWCKEMFDECKMTHQKSGWLCRKCYAYLKAQEV